MQIRVRRPADHAVVVLRREAVTDPRLTLTAIGVMTLLAALPDDRTITFSQLINRVGEDPLVVQSALDALEAAGYLVIDADLGPDGQAVLTDRPAATVPVMFPAAGRGVQRQPQPSPTIDHPAGTSAPTKQGASPKQPQKQRPAVVDDVASAQIRADALAQIRATLQTERSNREREQALAEAELRVKIEAAQAVRAQAVAERLAAQQAAAAAAGQQMGSSSGGPDVHVDDGEVVEQRPDPDPDAGGAP